MRFSILLYILFRILKRAAKKKKVYRDYLGNIHQVSILIRTEKGNRGRLFIFDRGEVYSRSGGKHDSDAAIVWRDAATAFRVMSSMSDEETSLAAARGDMKLDGMAFFAQWFNDGVKLAMEK